MYNTGGYTAAGTIQDKNRWGLWIAVFYALEPGGDGLCVGVNGFIHGGGMSDGYRDELVEVR